MPTILGANTLSSGYDVANSLRFNAADSPKLSKTISDGHDTNATFSCWFKRSKIGEAQTLFEVYEDSSNFFRVRLEADDLLQVRDMESGANQTRLKTTQVFTDVSAWYNVVVIVDTTDGTAGDRCKIFINGTRVTSFGTEVNYDQNDVIQAGVNGSSAMLGGAGANNNYLDGYIAEAVFLDGTSQAVSGFGEFDEDSPTIWKPIDVSGLTFGTNGFYLDFEDSSNLGNDKNGGTDLTETNIVAADQSTDTCTNNFCTLNPLYNHDGSYTLSEGNTQFLGTGGNDHTLGTLGVQGSGKWYFEVEFDTNKEACYAGFADSDLANNLASDAAGVTTFIGMYRDDETLNIGGSSEGAYTSVANGDIFGFAMNLDASSGSRTVIIQKNGSTIDTITIPTA